MLENEARLTNRQFLAISQIIEAPSLEIAAKRVKISKATLYTWLKDEVFKAELKRQRDEVIKDALGHLKTAMTKAVGGLIELMNTPRPDLKRWVYKDIIDYALKSIELEDIEERLDKVERVILERRSYR